MIRPRLLTLVGFLALASLGCGGPKTYPVRGKVVYADDTPLAGGLVVFHAVREDMPQVSPRGEIQEDGSFQLSSYNDNDGAPEGDYEVLVMPPPPSGSRSNPEAGTVDPRFWVTKTSGLTFTVKREKNEARFQVEKPKTPLRPPPPPPDDQ